MEINDKDNGKHKRNKWRNKTEFILTSLGYAIGIGNICRFPYLCYKNGGGAFLIPYLIMLFFCGVPLYFMETSLGQFSSCGCLTVFKIAPLFKGAGLSMIVVNFIVTTYLIMLCAYPLLFLYYSFGTVMPWTECSTDWNTLACFKAIFIMTIKTDTDITYDGKTFPKWTIDLGWDCCYVSMACIPLYMGYHLLYIEEGDFIQRIFSSFFPSKHWGPVDENTKLKWIREVKLRQVGGKFVKKRPQEILQLITTV